jgi:ribosome-associated translation inhibitor RaiA
MSLAEKQEIEEESFLPVLSNSVRGQLSTYETHVEKTLSMALQINVADQLSAEEAISFAGEARKMQKRIDGTRLKITEPYRDFVGEINSLAKKYTERLDKVSEIVESKITIWRQEETKKMSAVDISAALESGEEMSITIQDNSKVRAANCTAFERDIWKYEVKDIFEVPIDYLEIADNSVKLAIKNGLRDIPGLRIYKETVTQLRSR